MRPGAAGEAVAPATWKQAERRRGRGSAWVRLTGEDEDLQRKKNRRKEVRESEG